MKKIYIASDHAGFFVKGKIISILNKLNYIYEDLGPFNDSSVDYPDYAKKVALKVQSNLKNNVGILICGSGTGMQIVANKFNGIRAVFSYDIYSSEMGRKDNDANILTLRGRNFDETLYEKIVETFLITNFSNLERHKKRLDKIKKIEFENNSNGDSNSNN